MKKKNIIFTVIFLAVTVFIFTNSAKDAVISSEQSSFFALFLINNFPFILNDYDTAVVVIRKLAHFTEFFLQGISFSGIFPGYKYCKNIIYVLFIGLFSACIDEFIQLFFEGRAGMVIDIFIDFGGTVLSVIIYALLLFLYKKKRINS